ncbi:PEGA domain-containing protein, partial [Patescibacteria group bacterium]
MYRRPSKKREITMRVITYTAMVLSVLAIVSVLIFLILGYRIDTDNGKIEQSALLQYDTNPSGATVTVDGKTLGSKTSTKSTVLAGTHIFTMQKDGYELWQKTLDVKAGTLTWLNYTRLVPKNLKAQSVASYSTIYGSLGTTDGNTMIVQQSASIPTFQIVDLRSDTIKSTNFTIPANFYSEASTAGMVHTFTLNQWDSGGRYVLVQHTYGDKKEWLVIDTKDPNATKNITTLFDLDLTQLVFSGTSGNILYALSGTDLRQLDLSAGTISRALVSGVSSFSLYQTNVITYVGTDASDPNKTVVGLYREGDNAPHVLRSVVANGEPIHIATSHYFNQDYVAISQGKRVDITSGSYPSSSSDDISSLGAFASFTFSTNVDTMSFSPKGDYLVVQSGAAFESYDIEHRLMADYTLITEP